MPDSRALTTPPPHFTPDIASLAPLEIGPTLADWQQQRQALRNAWLQYLGHGPEVVPLEPEVHEEDLGDVTRSLLSYQVEDGCRVEAYLMRPKGDGPSPGVVVFHPTSEKTILGPVGLGSDPTQAFGLSLARKGMVTLSPRNFIWDYRGLKATRWEEYCQTTARLLNTWPRWTGMGKMLWDGLRAVDYLLTLPEVDAARIGCIGHSLGAKEVLYLMAFDERVRAGVSNDGGLGIPFSNWDAPWYLGEGVRGRPDLEHHQLLALCAPRAILIVGGGLEPAQLDEGRSPGSDIIEDWNYLEAARPAYDLHGVRERLCLFLHHKGHCVPPEAEAVIYPWLEHFLMAR